MAGLPYLPTKGRNHRPLPRAKRVHLRPLLLLLVVVVAVATVVVVPLQVVNDDKVRSKRVQRLEGGRELGLIQITPLVRPQDLRGSWSWGRNAHLSTDTFRRKRFVLLEA